MSYNNKIEIVPNMKTIITRGIILVVLSTLFSYYLYAQSSQDWGYWQSSDCYKNIYYRTRLFSDNGEMKHWQLQFKNQYTKLVSFSYLVTDDSSNTERIVKRTKMEAFEISKPIDYYFHKPDMFMIINQLSFSPYPQNIENCDTSFTKINRSDNDQN